MLIDKIKKDLTGAMKAGNDIQKMTLRMIMGEIPRLNLKAGEKATDEQVLSIIRKLVKSEKMTLEYSGIDEADSEYINILEGYLPKMMNEAEIQSWIVDNINIGDFNPKIKAMGAIMRYLNGKADGATVKKTLQGIEDFLERVDNL